MNAHGVCRHVVAIPVRRELCVVILCRVSEAVVQRRHRTVLRGLDEIRRWATGDIDSGDEPIARRQNHRCGVREDDDGFIRETGIRALIIEEACIRWRETFARHERHVRRGVGDFKSHTDRAAADDVTIKVVGVARAGVGVGVSDAVRERNEGRHSRKLTRHDGVVHVRDIRVIHAEEPASRRKRHGRGIGEHHDVFVGIARIETAVVVISQSRQRCATTRHEIHVAIHVEHTERDNRRVGRNVVEEIALQETGRVRVGRRH